MDSTNSYIDSLTRINKQKRQMLFNWIASQGEAIKIEAITLQSDLANQHRDRYDKQHRNEYYYAMLILALNKMHWTETAFAQKTALSDSDAMLVSKLRVHRLKANQKSKSAPKKELIRLRFFEEILTLKSEGLSWRQIAKYLHLHHKKSFTHGYLRNCYIEILAEKGGEI